MVSATTASRETWSMSWMIWRHFSVTTAYLGAFLASPTVLFVFSFFLGCVESFHAAAEELLPSSFSPSSSSSSSSSSLLGCPRELRRLL